MFHAFNMGLGMLVVVSPDSVAVAQAALEDAVFVVGQIKTDVEGAAGPVEIV